MGNSKSGQTIKKMEEKEGSIKEISVFDLLRRIYSKRTELIKVCVSFFMIGVIVAFTTPNEWIATSKLIPEDMSGNTSLGGFEGLAGLAGVQLPGGQEAGMNPELYRDIVHSTPFLHQLYEFNVFVSDEPDSISLAEYFDKYQRKTLIDKVLNVPSRILSLSSSSNNELMRYSGFDFISKDELEIHNDFRQRISVTFDKKLNVVTVSAKMQDAYLSAQVGQFVVEFISNFATDYQTAKEKRKLDFISERLQEKRAEFLKAQQMLAEFRDMNQGQLNNRALTERENLESQYDLAFNILSTLQQQYEEAGIRVEERSQIFSVLEPIKVPTLKSAPRRIFIMILYASFGLVLMVFYISVNLIKEKFN